MLYWCLDHFPILTFIAVMFAAMVVGWPAYLLDVLVDARRRRRTKLRIVVYGEPHRHGDPPRSIP